MAHSEFEEIYTEFHDKILRYVRRYVGEADAEDVAQGVFLKVSDGLERFEGRSSVGTWVYSIATNAALDHVRKQAARGRKLDLAASSPLASVATSPPPGGRGSPEGQAELREMNA